MEKLPISEVKKELEVIREDWADNKREEGWYPLSRTVYELIQIVSDDMKYCSLQVIGVPRKMLSDVINYIKPIVNDRYWEEVYGRDNFLRLFKIPKESHIKIPSD